MSAPPGWVLVLFDSACLHNSMHDPRSRESDVGMRRCPPLRTFGAGRAGGCPMPNAHVLCPGEVEMLILLLNFGGEKFSGRLG